MFNRISTETINWILIIGVILFIIEIVFFSAGLIFLAVIMGLIAYVGWKSYQTTFGKILFWTGSISILVIILNMNAVRFLILLCIILFLLDYYKTKRTLYLQPAQQDDHIIYPDDPIIRITPLFQQKFFNQQQTKDTAYEWRDINIHGIIGDRKIDLSNAIISDDTAIISIRHGVGNITIYIPYDVEFMIHHSAIFGRAYILHEHHNELLNQHLTYKTKYYDSANMRVKIITSLISGNIEVKRI